jgi:hypothetical protein
MIQKTPHRRHGADLAETALQRLAICLGVRRSHDKGHSRVRAALQEFIESVHAFLDGNERDTLRLVVRDRRLTHDGRALGLGDGTIAAIGKLLSARECGGVVFRADLTQASVNALLDWLMGRRARPAAASCSGMEVLEPSALDRAAPDRTPLGLDELSRVFHLAEAGHGLLEQVGAEIRQGHGLDAVEIREFARWTADVLTEEGLRIAAPALLLPPAPTPFGHALHVYLLSIGLLHGYARDRAELERFCLAAFMHDIGLCRVPESALRGESKRSEEDWRQIRCHPEYGADILLRCPGIPALAVEVAYCHHIRDENRGFPATSRRMRPGPVTDAVQVADRLETLLGGSNGGDPVIFREALVQLMDDPEMETKKDVIHAFHTGLTPMPPGTTVRVKSGAVGVVLNAYPETPQRPRIAVTNDRHGRRLAEPVTIDLRASDDENHQIEEILPRDKS